MTQTKVDIGINPEERKITLIVPIDEFFSCTKKNWSLLRDDIKKDLINNKFIEVITKDKE